jgi:hypothetical protein
MYLLVAVTKEPLQHLGSVLTQQGRRHADRRLAVAVLDRDACVEAASDEYTSQPLTLVPRRTMSLPGDGAIQPQASVRAASPARGMSPAVGCLTVSTIFRCCACSSLKASPTSRRGPHGSPPSFYTPSSSRRTHTSAPPVIAQEGECTREYFHE